MKNSELKSLWEEVKQLLSKLHSGESLEGEIAFHLNEMEGFENDEDAILYLTEVRNKLKPRKKAWGWVLGMLTLLVVAIGAIWLVGSMSQSGDAKSSAQSSAPSTSQTSNGSSAPAVKASEIEPFEIIPDGANVEGKIIANNSPANSLPGELGANIQGILAHAQHNVNGLKQGVDVWGIEVPKNITWTEKKNGKTFFTKEAQTLYYKYEKRLLKDAKAEDADNVGVSGYATGVIDGELVQDSNLRNYEGWSGTKFTYKGVSVYYLDYCGNIVTPGHVVKKVVPLPIPPQQPTPPTPPSQTPPPAAKDPKQDPAAQGNTPIGGGKNAGGVASETPSETPPSFPASYQAPAEQPATTTPSTGGGAGAATTPSTAIVNAPSGGFDDGNGRTNVGSNGAVTTPSTNYGGLQNTPPPPVQNGTTTNSGVNNGSQNGTDIPMED